MGIQIVPNFRPSRSVNFAYLAWTLVGWCRQFRTGHLPHVTVPALWSDLKPQAQRLSSPPDHHPHRADAPNCSPVDPILAATAPYRTIKCPSCAPPRGSPALASGCRSTGLPRLHGARRVPSARVRCVAAMRMPRRHLRSSLLGECTCAAGKGWTEIPEAKGERCH
jgi:hypothetical protein